MGEIRHLCNEQVFSCSRRRFDDGGVDLGGTMFRKHNAMHACCLGGAYQRAEVVDILNGVEDEEKWGCVFVDSVGKDIVNGNIFAFLDQCDTALVDSPMTDRVE